MLFRTLSSEVMLSALSKVAAALKFSQKSNLSHLASPAVLPADLLTFSEQLNIFLQWVLLD